jgi:hypothetical protein
MKKLLLLAIVAVFVWSCSTDSEEPTPAACQPTIIEDFDRASTFYYFEPGPNGKHLLDNISAYDGTDSAYAYTYTYEGTKVKTIARTEDGTTTTFTATYDGDNISKLSGTQLGFGIVTEELRVVYANGKASSWQIYVSDIQGTLQQIGNLDFTYNTDGDLASNSYNIDLGRLFTIGFGEVPSEPYQPITFFVNEYGYGSTPAPNPFYGVIDTEQPERSLMVNMPTSIVQRDLEGTLVGSLGYELSFNEQGFPTLANGGSRFIDITYSCN